MLNKGARRTPQITGLPLIALTFHKEASCLDKDPVHTGMILYHSTSVHSKKWYGEGLCSHGYRKKSSGPFQKRSRNSQGVTPINWDTGCDIFLGYFVGLKINFWVYFVACNKFLGHFFSLE